MKKSDMFAIDGKLLATFKTVFDEGSVTRSAIRLDTSQSSVSHALDRLRRIFDDPLFVRAGRTIAPTERAVWLAPAITEILKQLEGLADVEKFSEQNLTTQFVLSANDFERSLLASRIVSQLLQAAPRASLKLVDTRGPVEDSLRSRACDVVITPLNPLVSYDLHSQPLFDDRYLCYFDSKVVTPKRVSGHYLDMRHARVEFSRGDRSLIDDILRKKDQARDIAVVAPSFESLPQLMRDTALVATLPSRLAHSLFYGFGTCRVPFPSPTLRFQMIWHKTTHEAPKYRWFRSLIQNSNKL